MRFAELPTSPVPALQSLIEFGGLWELAQRENPFVVVEIGSLYGGTLWYWLQLARVVVSVDLTISEEEPVP